MTKKYIIRIIIFFGFFCLAGGKIYAQPISSTELINNARLYDGKTVSFEGEVIGDIMKRGDYAWINVNDGKSAIGIWVSTALVGDIVYSGGYKSKGDIIEVAGVFHRACTEHGGDLDIHAQAIHKTDTGRIAPKKLSVGKRNYAVVFGGILLLIWISTLLKRR